MKDVLEEDFDKITKRDISWDALRNSSFVITGATGLIGSLIVKYLLYANRTMNFGANIYAVVRNVEKADKIFAEEKTDALTYVVADLTKEKVNCEGDCDYIVHAAAVTASKVMVSDPVGTICTSIDGTEKMLQLAVEKKAKAFIYISSMEIYGQPTVGGKTAEKDLGYVDIENVRSCYPEGKRMCECLCTAYASQYGLNVKSARLAQTFGPGILPTENRVFAQFARSAMNGQNIVLHTMGTSEGNYVYTRDAVKAIIMLLTEGSAGQSYNIANEKSHMTIRQMAELVVNEIADNKIQVVIDVPKDNSSLGYAPGVKMWLDASKIRALGWQPEVDLAESYRRMIKWMER